MSNDSPTSLDIPALARSLVRHAPGWYSLPDADLPAGMGGGVGGSTNAMRAAAQLVEIYAEEIDRDEQ